MQTTTPKITPTKTPLVDGLEHILTVMDWDMVSVDALKTEIATLNQLRSATDEDLKQACVDVGLKTGEYAELRLLRSWYSLWKQNPSRNNIATDFTTGVWDRFIDEASVQGSIGKSAVTTPSSVHVVTNTQEDVVNSSFKVEAKEYPKLPKNTNLKGSVYNNWHDVIVVKFKQAKVGDLLKDDFVMPEPDDSEYSSFKTKDDYMNNTIISTTLSTNAYAFIDPSAHGFENFRALNKVFKGEDHIKNTALNAVDEFTKLTFGKNSSLSPEAFVSKFLDCLRKMKEDDAEIKEKLLPGLFRSKITHPSFALWKELNEKNQDDWTTTLREFIAKAEIMDLKTSDGGKFNVNNSNNSNKKGDRVVQDKKKRVEEGARFAPWEWAILTDDEKEKVKRKNREKREAKKARRLQATPNAAGGGLPSQYQVHNGVISLPPGATLPVGTTFIPNVTDNTHNVVNNVNGSIHNSNPSGDPHRATTPNQSNVQRAINMLTLQPNGQFSVRNQMFRLSTQVEKVMSVQSYAQKTKAKGSCYADGGTNICAMGRHFRTIAYSGRYANMTGFANDLEKHDVPIASGLTKVMDRWGQPCLLGMHEAAELKYNESSLISTNQSREAGTWIDDVMKRHGGTQTIVAQVEGWDNETREFDLEAESGLLKIECQYPTDDELNSLPRVWLTANEKPWDPDVLDDDTVTVPSCYQTNHQVTDSDTEDNKKHDMEELMEMDNFAKQVGRQNVLVQAIWIATGMSTIANVTSKVMNLVGSKTSKRSAKIKDPDLDLYRPRLGWLPLETIKKTFENTTQLYMHVPSFHPFRKHLKSRAPQLNVPRLAETYATDTGFASETALGGINCFQLFVGKSSLRTAVFGMQSEDQGPEALEDFIRDKGAPYVIKNDNSKMQTSKAWSKILRKYNIAEENTEPHNPQQNPAERRIQDVKRNTSRILDRTGAPAFLWFKCMCYVVMLLNMCACEALNWQTPNFVGLGKVDDISPLLQYSFYEPVYYATDETFPNVQEDIGHWCGVAENKGDALTYWILTDKNTLLARSLVRPVSDRENLRTETPMPPSDDTEVTGSRQSGVQLDLLGEMANSQCPEFDPSMHMGYTFVREDKRSVPTKTSVVEVDEDTGRVLLEYISGELEWVEPNIVQEAILSKIEDDGDGFYTFSEILSHKKGPNNRLELEILWDNGDVSWEPLANVRKDDPITLAKYAKDNNLLNQRGWSWARKIVKNNKKYERMYKLMQGQKVQGPKYKFGIQVPRTKKEARMLDEKNNNTLWEDAMTTEANALLDLNTFREPKPGENLEKHQFVPLVYAFDVKFDGRRRARICANGSVVDKLADSEVYSGVVSNDSVRLIMFLAKLNGLKICAADIGSAYLMAETKEKITTKLGPGFGEWTGKTVVVHKALYGLLGSCAQFHAHLSANLKKIGFEPSWADANIWMKKKGDHYEYIGVYIDDLIVVSKDPMAILDQLKEPVGPYNLKGVGTPEYYLGGDVVIRYVDDVIDYLETNARTYIKRICDKLELLMEWKFRNYSSPEEHDYHPEVDESPFLEGDLVSKYRMMVGSLNWLVTLGRYDVHHAASTLARHMMMPREGHLQAMRRVFCYLKYHPKFAIKYDTDEPDISGYNVEEYDWYPMYGDPKEEMPYGMPEPLGLGVVLTGFFDASHACCLQTRRSMSSFLMFINKTPIHWFAKRQNTVETSTFGSECVAGRVAVDAAVELRYKLRMLGVPVKGSTLLFGDNESMVNQVTKPHSTLKKRHLANCYHRCREAVASKIVSIVHCASGWNLSDMGTKGLPAHIHQRLLHNQVLPPFQCSRECWMEMQKEQREVLRSASKVARNESQERMMTHKATPNQEPRPNVEVKCSNVVSLSIDDYNGASCPGNANTTPIFVMKYGEEMIPVHGNSTDCHVADLAHAFHDERFVQRVINHGRATLSE